MQKHIVTFAAVFVLMGGSALAQSLTTQGLNFIAPNINGRSYVGSPATGEIVFDSSVSPSGGFFGYNGTGWIDMNAGSVAVPPGTIVAYGGVNAPSGYVLCDGAPYTATAQPALAAALWDSSNGKYAFGGSGTYPSGSFNVPDLRGRFLRGADLGAGRDPNTTATDRPAMNAGGNTGQYVGSIQGQATKKNGLALSDPGHRHDLNYPSGGGGTMGIQPVSGNNSPVTMGADPTGKTNSAATGITLGSGDAETRPINANVNYIIKL
jgi:hypothetical protein